MKKITALLLVLLVIVSACSMSLAEDKKTLSFIRLGDLVKAEPIFAPIAKGFEEENNDYTVEFGAMSWAEATTKLKLLGAQQKLPDVLFINIINGWDLASNGYLADLSELVAKDPVLSEELSQSVLDTVTTADGKLYWVPAATGAFCLWYNKDLFEQAGLDPNSPPQTMEEMLEYAKQITEKTGVPGLGWGINAMEDFAHVVISFYSSYTGADIWDDATRTFTFESNAEYRDLFVQALTEMYKITNEYGITQPNPVELNPYGVRPLFRDGQVAMYLDGVWAVKELLTELEKGEESKFTTALFPAGPAGSHPIMGCDGWAIPASAPDPEGSWKLLTYLMRSDNQTRHATMWGLLPILASENDKEEFSAPYWRAMIQQRETVSGRPKDKQVAMIELAVAEYAQAAALGELSPEVAIDEMIAYVQDNLVD